jgi:hypothetical protein
MAPGRYNRTAALVGILTVAAVLFAVVALQAKGERMVSRPPPRGLATWVYHYMPGIARQVKRFDGKARPGGRFRYFFPYAGSPSFGAARRSVTMHYDATATRAYARALPRDVLLLPIVDARNDDKSFDGWTEEQYREAAREVARCVLDDPDAAGVQIDVEPFSPGHLPFYRSLRELLNAKGKYSTMFVGARDEETLKRIFAASDVVVISGYDLDVEGMSLARYEQALRGSLARVQRAAEAAGGHYLLGIPAAASWGEYEYIAGGGAARRETGVKQEQYVQAALDAVKPYRNRPQYLGLSLWHMSDPETEHEQPEAARSPTKFPDVIRPSVWRMLERYP